MLTESELQRMEIAKSTTRETNCIGTALYVKGYIDEDRIIDYHEGTRKGESKLIDTVLSQMKLIDNPQEGALLVITSRYDIYLHMGIVVNGNPLLIYQRPYIDGKIQQSIPIRDTISPYNCRDVVEFYIEKDKPIENKTRPNIFSKTIKLLHTS